MKEFKAILNNTLFAKCHLVRNAHIAIIPSAIAGGLFLQNFLPRNEKMAKSGPQKIVTNALIFGYGAANGWAISLFVTAVLQVPPRIVIAAATIACINEGSKLLGIKDFPRTK